MFILILFFSLISQSFANMDLHMHMTMDVPLSPFYKGGLNDNVVATDWRSRNKSRIDFQSLEKSELKLVVPVISINGLWGDIEKQFDGQMAELQKFCELHPKWKIVKEPQEARRELAKGNKVFILSAEGLYYFKERELFNKLMAKYPIRIATPLHFMDFSHVIGIAAEQKGLAGKIQWAMDTLFPPKFAAFSARGESLVHYLLDHHIWVDLSHSSEAAVNYFVNMRPPGYPLLMTHTVLRKYYGTDRGISDDFMSLVSREGGVVGLIPSMTMLEGTPTVANDCEKGNPYLVQWRELTGKVKLKNAYLGSDMNSPLAGVPAVNEVCTVTPYGVRTVADLRTLSYLQDRKAISNFLQQWEKVRPIVVVPKRIGMK